MKLLSTFAWPLVALVRCCFSVRAGRAGTMQAPSAYAVPKPIRRARPASASPRRLESPARPQRQSRPIPRTGRPPPDAPVDQHYPLTRLTARPPTVQTRRYLGEPFHGVGQESGV